jgi:suppressor for copper-sensitivity B
MVLLFFAFGQLGKLEINLGLESFADRLLNKLSTGERLTNLSYGALIVLLATPCTAPFLGSAVGFALTQNLATIFIIFTAIACGLATPWVLFMLSPRGASRVIAGVRNKNLSRVFYSLVTLLLYGSALWLLWVLAYQIGALPAISIFILMHLIFSFWQKIFLAPVFLIALILSLLALPSVPEPLMLDANLNWQRLNAEAIKQQNGLGKKVFIDITAKWCITCKYNKINVLSDPEVQQRLRQKDIYLMRGDLTQPNEKITRFIQKHHRIGIPFNALYTRGDFYIFSEILDKKTLLAKLN